ncbi:hypothetical protein HOR13_gp43 [Xanthomonas phage XAJ24]|uniref:Uncharacterized protein n=1 Tax=Xanthomonas phage XAJ24 TaxID=1775250 RepID=A0A1I9L290_9CAUD|nr:hypothetical protein HOR13_gp43 [Xanthomonas phage XAJ24]AMW36077.1 hypothetical protein [Xanthomonas phage XAJ24]
MSKELSSWIEITVPSSLLKSLDKELDAAVNAIGGMTMTAGQGFYKRQDNGQIDFEQVAILRWDFDYMRDGGEVFKATSAVTNKMLELGEECVLRRRAYTVDESSYYKSELIFK